MPKKDRLDLKIVLLRPLLRTLRKLPKRLLCRVAVQCVAFFVGRSFGNSLARKMQFASQVRLIDSANPGVFERDFLPG